MLVAWVSSTFVHSLLSHLRKDSPTFPQFCLHIQAVRLSSELRDTIAACKCSPQTMLKAAQSVKSGLTYSSRNIKRTLSPVLRTLRKNEAWRGFQRPEYWYKTLIYADETTIRPLPERGMCWTVSGQHPIEDDPRYEDLNFGLHMFLAVHPYEGVLHCRILSRTKGHEKHGWFYEVSQFVTIEGRP